MAGQASPPRWSVEQIQADIATAIANFRDERIQEPLEQYLDAFDRYRADVEDLIEETVDLSWLVDLAVECVSDAGRLSVVRYLAAPPISEDDLKTTADVPSLAPGRLQDPEIARQVVQTVLGALDRNRFPWVGEDREPSDAERETAVVSTAALMATRRVMTDRANTSKVAQEEAVAERLIEEGLRQVPTRAISNLTKAPAPGEFCRESSFGGRKADLVVGLWDGRKMPVECKVSNSSTNSVKRLNNDAAAKARTWLHEFGAAGIVPTAVLAGVFKVHNVESAQRDGLTVFWAHDLDALAEFVEATRS